MRFALIACGKSKLDRPAPARELYTGDLFRKSVAYADAIGAPWFVLSARYGLVAPGDVIEPYEATLIGATRQQRDRWTHRIIVDLAELGFTAGPIVMLAGAEYRRDLVPFFEGAGVKVKTPLAGLGIGRQKQWLQWAVENGEMIERS